jgi:hypothetical protein
MIALTQLLNYAATNPEATILYSASDTVLHVSSDASYLTAPKARSRARSYHYFISRPINQTNHPFLRIRTHQTMAPSTFRATSCVKSFQAPPKPNSLAYFTMAKRLVLYEPASPNLTILNHRRPYKLKTARLPVSATTASNKNAPKPWACVFIGFKTTFAKANF